MVVVSRNDRPFQGGRRGGSIDDHSGSGGGAHGWDDDDDHNGNRLAVSRFFACKLGQITRRVGSRGLCLKKERIIDEVTERETIYVLVLFTLYQVRVSRHENIRHVLLLIFCQF